LHKAFSRELFRFSCFVLGVDRLDKDLTIGQMQGKSSSNCAMGPFLRARRWAILGKLIFWGGEYTERA
jgi:hypothetical protein